MFETITKSIELTKKSFGVLASEKKLLIFPLISAIAMIVLIASFIIPFVITEKLESLGLVLLFLFYMLFYAIAIFFNTALIHAVNNKLEGKTVSVGGSISFALTKIVNILAWAFISATVGMIIRALSSGRGIAGLVGRLVASVIGIAWSFATYFVIPVMVFEDTNPLDALRKSVGLIKKTWGESIVGGIGIGGAFFFIYLGVVLLGFAGILSGGPIGMIIFAIAVVLFILVALAQSTVNAIFITSLYQYATKGQSVVFQKEDMDAAFKQQATKKGWF